MTFKETMGFDGAKDIAIATIRMRQVEGNYDPIDVIAQYQANCIRVMIAEGLDRDLAETIVTMCYYYADTNNKKAHEIITALNCQHEFALALFRKMK